MPHSQQNARAVYLDTNIAIRFIENRSCTYRSLFDAIKHKVASQDWLCYLSEFAIMEMYDQFQRHEKVRQELRHGELVGTILFRLRHRELARSGFLKAERKVTGWYKANSSVLTVDTPEYRSTQILFLAGRICAHSDITASDSMHLALALLLGCDLLLTGDGPFRREVNERLSNNRTKFNIETVRALARIVGTPVSEIRRTADSQGRIVAAYVAPEFLQEFGH